MKAIRYGLRIWMLGMAVSFLNLTPANALNIRIGDDPLSGIVFINDNGAGDNNSLPNIIDFDVDLPGAGFTAAGRLLQFLPGTAPFVMPDQAAIILTDLTVTATDLPDFVGGTNLLLDSISFDSSGFGPFGLPVTGSLHLSGSFSGVSQEVGLEAAVAGIPAGGTIGNVLRVGGPGMFAPIDVTRTFVPSGITPGAATGLEGTLSFAMRGVGDTLTLPGSAAICAQGGTGADPCAGILVPSPGSPGVLEPVPEPSTLLLLALGLAGSLGFGRKSFMKG